MLTLPTRPFLTLPPFPLDELDLLATPFLSTFYGLITDVLGDPYSQLSFNNLIHLMTNGTNRLNLTALPSHG